MKTVSERHAEDRAVREAEKAREDTATQAAIKYLDEVEAKDIPAHVGRYASGSGEYRSKLRAQIRTGGHNGFIDTACDHCKTALWDRDPMMTCMSAPPCFWADCAGCGATTTLRMQYRTKLSFE